ncbi:hypothetical protein Cni_G18684 [Canna indica]|uniref:DUF3741 domain-containing protein n=1 Tax=Canna indica TaxID=4628 RepID=A0AAQ3QJ03_9LILI|nr:hypothetical protein Cni_G18684 [Canna indica]
MINIFDLSAGMPASKMLTEKAHRDAGTPIHRRKQDINKSATPSTANIDGKQINSDTKQKSSTKKSGGTPVKMLIAQEMSKETESKRKSPSVVARLMGLDDNLTAQPYLVSSQRNLLEVLPPTSSVVCRNYHQQDAFFNTAFPYEICQHNHQNMEQTDTNEVWKKQSRSGRGRYDENHNELRMALVREKFIEAKRLATDEKLLQSKEFQDVLEVLSSNRDLFLKFLEEPYSLFTKQPNNLHSIPPLPQTKRITVLKPSKNVETKFEKLVKKQEFPEIDESGCGTTNCHFNSNFNQLETGSFSQPTRIVVLKPSTGKTTKVLAPNISSEHLVHSKFYGDSMDNGAFRLGFNSSERAQQMQKSLTGHRRDESLLSSILSNGYGGDGSSFNHSEIDYNEEPGGGFSDSEIEVVTPTSRRSWDRIGSPYSVSSFSRISYSPESSVTREAKKRISERCALMASNGISQQQLHLPRSSSTLGEMLAIPEAKREECVNRYTASSSRSCGGEDEMRSSAFCLSVSRTTNSGEVSPGNLSRSKSVPVSSSAYKDIGLKVEGSDPQISKSTQAEVSKSKHGKLSFAGKVSSLFFSRSKKSSRERPVSSALVGSRNSDKVVVRTDEMHKSVRNCLAMDYQLNGEKCVGEDSAMSVMNVPKKATPSLEQPSTGSKSTEQDKLIPHQNSINHLDQPSPTSVLDAPFEDDLNESLCHPSEANAEQKALSRALPIESVARTLSWDDTNQEMLSPKPSNLYRVLSKAEDCEQEYFLFVQKLLSYAGLEKSDMIFTGWHSLDSPLDPMLLDKILDLKEEEFQCIEKRSNLRLLFDCVNSTLLELSCSTLMSIYPWNRVSCGTRVVAHASSSLAENVWGLARDWFCGKRKLVFAEIENSIVVDGALREEVGGNKWSELIMTEFEEITKEISGEVSSPESGGELPRHRNQAKLLLPFATCWRRRGAVPHYRRQRRSIISYSHHPLHFAAAALLVSLPHPPDLSANIFNPRFPNSAVGHHPLHDYTVPSRRRPLEQCIHLHSAIDASSVHLLRFFLNLKSQVQMVNALSVEVADGTIEVVDPRPPLSAGAAVIVEAAMVVVHHPTHAPTSHVTP